MTGTEHDCPVRPPRALMKPHGSPYAVIEAHPARNGKETVPC